jgi:hypothetical protein
MPPNCPLDIYETGSSVRYGVRLSLDSMLHLASSCSYEIPRFRRRCSRHFGWKAKEARARFRPAGGGNGNFGIKPGDCFARESCGSGIAGSNAK